MVSIYDYMYAFLFLSFFQSFFSKRYFCLFIKLCYCYKWGFFSFKVFFQFHKNPSHHNNFTKKLTIIKIRLKAGGWIPWPGKTKVFIYNIFFFLKKFTPTIKRKFLYIIFILKKKIYPYNKNMHTLTLSPAGWI